MKKQIPYRKIIIILSLVVSVFVAYNVMVLRYKNPKLTETEIFIKLIGL